MADSAQLDSRASFAGATVAAQWPKRDWWRGYGDPQLDAMIDEALAGSPDMAAAMARVRIALGVLESAGAATLPQVGGSARAGANKQSYNNGIPADFVPKGWKSTGDAALNFSFDLDLWGRNKANLATATSNAQAAEVDARQAQLVLTSAIVAGYADLARMFAEQEVLEKTVEVRGTSADLAAKRVKAGLDNEGPASQANARLASARYELELKREQIALQRHALAALMGKGPDRGLAIERPSAAVLVPTPLPDDAGIALAGRRPDIVAARLRVEAQGHKIDAAKAAFMPDISLSGLLGFQSLGLSHLFDSGSDYGNAGAAISLPIFQGGRLTGDYRQARGGYDQAVADYNKTVLVALREVADAVASRQSAERQLAEADQALAEAQRGYQLLLARYKAGLATYLDVLSAEDTMLAASRTVTDAHYRRVTLDVALVRALGGGFSAQDMKDQQS